MAIEMIYHLDSGNSEDGNTGVNFVGGAKKMHIRQVNQSTGRLER